MLRKQDGSWVEDARSAAFEWEESAATPAIEAVEHKRKDRFDVSIHHFSPTGNHTYVFVHRGSDWILAGSEERYIMLVPEHGDEAVGDTAEMRSVNYLTGRAIETHYRGNKKYSEKSCTTGRIRVRLQEFNVFSSEIQVYCGDDA